MLAAAETAAVVASLPDDATASLRQQQDLMERTWARASEALALLTERLREL